MANTDIHRGRDLPSNVTQGRVICRLVAMFDSVDELVEENDRRHALEDEEEPTPEYFLFFLPLTLMD